jgi:hypothetical protein
MGLSNSKLCSTCIIVEFQLCTMVSGNHGLEVDVNLGALIHSQSAGFWAHHKWSEISQDNNFDQAVNLKSNISSDIFEHIASSSNPLSGHPETLRPLPLPPTIIPSSSTPSYSPLPLKPSSNCPWPLTCV